VLIVVFNNGSNKYQNNRNLPAATPSPPTTETVIAASIAGSQSNFQEFEKNQPSNIKHHRLNSCHNGKIFFEGKFLVTFI
jgi:hypothetical protein